MTCIERVWLGLLSLAGILSADSLPMISYNTTSSTLSCNGVAGCVPVTSNSVSINGIKVTYNPVNATAAMPSIINFGNLTVSGSGMEVDVTGVSLSININSTPPGASGLLPNGILSGKLGTNYSKATISFNGGSTTTNFGTLPGVIIGRSWSSYIYQVLDPTLGLQAPAIGNPMGLTSIQGAVTDNSSGAQAFFVKYDDTTAGSWKGKYGADGQVIAGDVFSPPAYASVSTGAAQSWVWLYTNDPRAMQRANVPGRISSTYYANPNFSINVNMTDGALHQVAMYFLDWDYSSRAQTITIRDTSTNDLLDTRSISGFSPGRWIVWNMKGNVTIQFTRTVGPNAVVSGIFIQ